jgi:diguanylate cyclase (GGDEF)-like protein
VEPFFERIGPGGAAALTLLLVAVIGYADYLTGTELRVFPLYFLPVGLASWRLGRRAGALVSVLSALTWYFANALAGQAYSQPYVEYLNAASVMAGLLVISLLIAMQRRLLLQERVLARSDSLTGLSNRRAFLEAFESELERARRYQRPLTLAFLDLDNFKPVNDSMGHRVGDELLRQVAATLQEFTRTTDIVGRYGGDEFAVLLVEAGPEAAPAALEKLRRRIGHAMMERKWPVSCSIGAVTWLSGAVTPEELLRQADELMYEAKQSGKDSLRHAMAKVREVAASA